MSCARVVVRLVDRARRAPAQPRGKIALRHGKPARSGVVRARTVEIVVVDGALRGPHRRVAGIAHGPAAPSAPAGILVSAQAVLQQVQESRRIAFRNPGSGFLHGRPHHVAAAPELGPGNARETEVIEDVAFDHLPAVTPYTIPGAQRALRRHVRAQPLAAEVRFVPGQHDVARTIAPDARGHLPQLHVRPAGGDVVTVTAVLQFERNDDRFLRDFLAHVLPAAGAGEILFDRQQCAGYRARPTSGLQVDRSGNVVEQDLLDQVRAG